MGSVFMGGTLMAYKIEQYSLYFQQIIQLMITQSELLHTGMDLFSVQRTAGPITRLL